MIRKSIGPLCFTALVLLFVNFIFEFNFSFLSSLKSAQQELEMKDIYFSKIQNNEKKLTDTNIVLLDIDTCKREQILELLKRVNRYEPKVVGVDVLFEEDEPCETHMNFVMYANSNSNTVFAAKHTEKNELLHSFFISETSPRVTEGLVNFGNSGDGQPIRSVMNKDSDDVDIMSFSAKIVQLYNPELQALKRVEDDNAILLNYKAIEFPNEFKAIEIINDSSNSLSSKIKGKIVLVGALNDEKDTHKIPNAGYKDSENLYTMESGIKIHAMAIYMLLNNNLLTEPSTFWNFVLTSLVFIIFFYILFFLFEKYEFYFKLTGRLVLLLCGIFFLLLYVMFMKSGIEIGIGYWFFMLFLIYEMLEVYEPVMSLLRNGCERIKQFTFKTKKNYEK
jgi:CHASE2 domain-containing sensor protein